MLSKYGVELLLGDNIRDDELIKVLKMN